MDDCQFYKVLAVVWPQAYSGTLPMASAYKKADSDLHFLADLERITPYITYTKHSDLFIVFLDITPNESQRKGPSIKDDQSRVHHLIKRIGVIHRRWQTPDHTAINNENNAISPFQTIRKSPFFVAAQTAGEAHALASLYKPSHSYAGNCLFFSPHTLAHLPIATLPFFYSPFSPKLFTQETSWLTLEKRLKRLRVLSVYDFLELNPKQLSSHLGHTCELLWHHIQLRRDQPWTFFKAAEKIEATLHMDDWPIGCDSLEPFLFVFKQLLDRCFSRLWCQSAKLRQFRIEIKTTDLQNPIRLLTVNLHTLASSTHHVLNITRLKLYQEFEQNPLDGYCKQVTVYFDEIHHYHGRQRNFFSHKDDHLDQIKELQDRIDTKLGQASTYQIEFLDSHWPENSWGRLYRQPEDPTQKRPPLTHHADIVTPARPTRLLPTPLPLENLGLHLWRCPTLNELWTAASISQPEFLCDEWWQTSQETPTLLTTRRYFKMITSQERSFWIFQDNANQWYLHGFFD